MSSAVAPARLIDSKLGEFRFLEGPHEYYVGDRLLWGITGILKECGYIDPTWYSEESRRRGSNVHKAIHFLNKGTLDWSSVNDAYLGYVIGYQKLMEDFQIKPIMFEQPLYHPELWYAGTPDIVTADAIWELKTGVVPKWAALQTAGQDMLVRAWDVTSRRRNRMGVQLKADGTYAKPVHFKEWARDEAVFRNLVSAINSRELYGVKHKPQEA